MSQLFFWSFRIWNLRFGEVLQLTLQVQTIGIPLTSSKISACNLAALQVVNTLGIMRRLAKARVQPAQPSGSKCHCRVRIHDTTMKFSGPKRRFFRTFHSGVRGVNSCCIHGNGFYITGGTESISLCSLWLMDADDSSISQISMFNLEPLQRDEININQYLHSWYFLENV